MTTTANEMRTADVTEIARHARAMLRSAFPGAAFSIKSSRYSGGSSVRIDWIDGPSRSEVELVTRSLEGRSFDGMTDSSDYRTVTLPTGEEVRAYSFVMLSRMDSRSEAR